LVRGVTCGEDADAGGRSAHGRSHDFDRTSGRAQRGIAPANFGADQYEPGTDRTHPLHCLTARDSGRFVIVDHEASPELVDQA
jgi:hypothetical protein